MSSFGSSYSDDGIPVWAYIVFLAVILIGAVIWDSIDSQNWDKFSAAHSCKHVGSTSGHYNIGFGKGNDGEWVSATYSWLCDDGVTYTNGHAP